MKIPTREFSKLCTDEELIWRYGLTRQQLRAIYAIKGIKVEGMKKCFKSGKIQMSKFETREFADMCWKSHGVRLVGYVCPYCDFWHITHKVKKEKRKSHIEHREKRTNEIYKK